MIREGVIKEKTFIFENSKEKTFISILILVLVLVGSIFWAYTFGQRFASTVQASKGAAKFANAANDNDLQLAQNLYAQALQLSSQDVYLRAVANIGLSRAQVALNDSTISVDRRRVNFISAYQTAFSAGNAAININNSNYQNYLSRGAVSESLVSLDEASRNSLQLPDQYLESKNYYEQAQKLNPKSPLIQLLLARLQYNKGDINTAKQYITNALALKANYTDAFLLLAQIQYAEKDNQGALNTLLSGSLIAPDPVIFFSLGNLQYNNKDYLGASDSFSKAVSLDPYNIRARAFLAYSFYNSGRTNDAITVLNSIKQIDPRSTDDVNKLIDNFNKGIVTNVGSNNLTSTSTTATSTSITPSPTTKKELDNG